MNPTCDVAGCGADAVCGIGPVDTILHLCAGHVGEAVANTIRAMNHRMEEILRLARKRGPTK